MFERELYVWRISLGGYQDAILIVRSRDETSARAAVIRQLVEGAYSDETLVEGISALLENDPDVISNSGDAVLIIE